MINKIYFLFFIFFIFVGCETSSSSYYSQSSYTTYESNEEKCDRIMKAKIYKADTAHNIANKNYKNNIKMNSCPDPTYESSAYIPECKGIYKQPIVFRQCSQGISLKTGKREQMYWSEKYCIYLCKEICADKSKCGSAFEKTSSWLGDWWDGDSKEEKKKKKKKSTTTCRTLYDGSIRCTTYE
tara:strand:- start:67 stop:615 length:549 start_codon:yes stop_codon:yes gene_type:complete